MAARRLGLGNIFGTPPEPHFNLENYRLEGILLFDCFQNLIKDNSDEIQEAQAAGNKISQGCFKRGDAAEFIFLSCELFHLPDEMKYLALELFDRFMFNHVRELQEHVKSQSQGEQLEKDWSTVMERIKNQIQLRAISCIQIATKLISHQKIITPRRLMIRLNELGHNYSMKSILQSELRIMKAVHFKLALKTPMLYIETLLEIIGLNNADRRPKIKQYYGMCLKLLDLFYLHREEIFCQLLLPTFENDYQTGRDEFHPHKHNNLLIAGAIISAAIYVGDQEYTNEVIREMSFWTGIPSDDILDFATVFIRLIVSGSET